MSLQMKKIFKKADILKQIQEAAKKNLNLKSGLENYIYNVQELLRTQTKWLVLHNILLKLKNLLMKKLLKSFLK
jgi:hypothetical protein